MCDRYPLYPVTGALRYALLCTSLVAFGNAAAATFVVSTTIDAVDISPGNGICATAGGQCSLRAAIQEANASPGADTIQIPAGTYTLTLSGQNEDLAATGDLDIREAVTVQGAGAATTVIDGGALDRVFDLCPTGSCGSGTPVALAGITVRNGHLPKGAGDGGGVYNRSRLTMTDCAISGNTLESDGTGGNVGGGIANADSSMMLTRVTVSGNHAFAAGGLFTSCPHVAAYTDIVTLTESAVSGNFADNGGTGGIGTKSRTVLTLLRSNVSGNQAFGDGGGIRAQGKIRIVDSTISGNVALHGDDGALRLEDGGADIMLQNATVADNSGSACGGICIDSVDISPRISIVNSILRNNSCRMANSLWSSLGSNIDSGNTCGFGDPTDRVNTDPLIGPLANNGGSTQTRALLAGSPAVDRGRDEYCNAADQRGVARPGCACDIGAYEPQNTAPVFTVTKTQDTNDGACTAQNCSLRDAVIAANANPDRNIIVVPAGTYTLQIPGQNEDAAATGDLDLLNDVIVRGGGRDATLIDGASLDRVFQIHSAAGSFVKLCDLTVQHGNVSSEGGAVQSDASGGEMALVRTRVANCQSHYGAVASWRTPTTLVDCVVENNSAADGGGGIWNLAPLGLVRTSIRNNTSPADGGGIWLQAVGNIKDCTISGNTVTGSGGSGGGIYYGSGIAPLSVTNTTVSGNSAVQSGGGIWTYDAVLRNVTIADNTVGNTPNGIDYGGGVMVTVESSIVADGCSGIGLDSLGNNIDRGTSCLVSSTLGDLVNTDPKLLPLANNGGPTLTHALDPSSPAINAGGECVDASGNHLFTDQRGGARPYDGCDIGAFEYLGPCVDADGDGVGAVANPLCPIPGIADCNDGVSSCSSDCATDADGDHIPDCADACIDADGDGYGTPGGAGNSCLGLDCSDAYGAVWATPGEVRSLVWPSGKTTLSWTAPTSLGASSVVYDTLRSTSASNFLGAATCVESNDGSNTTAQDATVPAAGQVAYYLTRAENLCPNGAGSLGSASFGAERAGRNCP